MTLGAGSGNPWRLNQLKRWPRFIEYIGIEEFKAVQIKFDATPRMGFQQIAEIISQLGFGQIINFIIEIGTDAPHGAGIGLDVRRQLSCPGALPH
jgi:hypothetical protein